MPEVDEITDLTRGVYRRQYAGFVGGKRINRLSLEAEAWFWRVHAAADDFGNVAADPALLYTATAGRRAGTITIDRVMDLIKESIHADLLLEYTIGEETYLHVVGFDVLQPAGKNGKRVRRVPASPWDGGSNGTADRQAPDAAATPEKAPKKRIKSDAGESRGIQKNPGVPSASDSDTHSDTDTDAHPAAQAAGVAAAAARPATSAPESPVVLEFEVIANDGKPWLLRQSLFDELAQGFPDLDAMAEFRAARLYCAAKSSNRKTPRGMRPFLTSWLTRSQNTPRLRAKPADAVGDASRSTIPPSRATARAAEFEKALQ